MTSFAKVSEFISLVDDPTLDLVQDLINNARMKLRLDGGSGCRFENLEVGDTITISDQARPKYLCGHTGTITKKNRTRVVVDLDKPVGRYSTGITCPPSLINLED
jgi:hypothetical protein